MYNLFVDVATVLFGVFSVAILVGVFAVVLAMTLWSIAIYKRFLVYTLRYLSNYKSIEV